MVLKDPDVQKLLAAPRGQRAAYPDESVRVVLPPGLTIGGDLSIRRHEAHYFTVAMNLFTRFRTMTMNEVIDKSGVLRASDIPNTQRSALTEPWARYLFPASIFFSSVWIREDDVARFLDQEISRIIWVDKDPVHAFRRDFGALGHLWELAWPVARGFGRMPNFDPNEVVVRVLRAVDRDVATQLREVLENSPGDASDDTAPFPVKALDVECVVALWHRSPQRRLPYRFRTWRLARIISRLVSFAQAGSPRGSVDELAAFLCSVVDLAVQPTGIADRGADTTPEDVFARIVRGWGVPWEASSAPATHT
jgi:hypothetical protein